MTLLVIGAFLLVFVGTLSVCEVIATWLERKR